MWTTDVTSTYAGERQTLSDILELDADVPAQFYVNEDELKQWRFLNTIPTNILGR